MKRMKIWLFGVAVALILLAAPIGSFSLHASAEEDGIIPKTPATVTSNEEDGIIPTGTTVTTNEEDGIIPTGPASTTN